MSWLRVLFFDCFLPADSGPCSCRQITVYLWLAGCIVFNVGKLNLTRIKKFAHSAAETDIKAFRKIPPVATIWHVVWHLRLLPRQSGIDFYSSFSSSTLRSCTKSIPPQPIWKIAHSFVRTASKRLHQHQREWINERWTNLNKQQTKKRNKSSWTETNTTTAKKPIELKRTMIIRTEKRWWKAQEEKMESKEEMKFVTQWMN